MTEPRYTIICTREQLGEIRRALEACFRFGIGQAGDILQYPRNREGERVADSWDVRERIESIVNAEVGLQRNQSWGVGKFDDLDQLCEMYTVIRHFLSWEDAVNEGKVKSMDSPREWKTMMGCHYDKPMKWTQKPLIAVGRVE